jgi:hypothetical protein
MNPLADVTENEWPRVFRCTESMSGWNYDGSSKDKPHMVSDLFNERTYWIEFWEKITGRKRKDTICSYEGCTNRLLVGGHIWLSKQAGSPYKWCYIAPICQTCNNKRLEPDRELGSGSHLKKGTLVLFLDHAFAESMSGIQSQSEKMSVRSDTRYFLALQRTNLAPSRKWPSNACHTSHTHHARHKMCPRSAPRLSRARRGDRARGDRPRGCRAPDRARNDHST